MKRLPRDLDGFRKHFDGLLDKTSGDGCWRWTKCVNPKGYGLMERRPPHNEVMAHRIAYVLEHGPTPYGMFVLHSCDNPRCCNPAHLWLGTLNDNVQDMMIKGRNNNVRSRLTAEKAREIRSSDLGVDELAKKYDVGRVAIANVLAFISWKHLENRS